MEMTRTTDGNKWIQVSVPTGDPDVKRIKAELKKTWKKVWTSPLGNQLTQYGVVKLTMVNGRND